ncbi:MAG: hypothetical protein U0L49_06185, partial [Eubacterium sp.]|nr:hypothetical protein [Eubacterium sp.]
LKEIFLPLICNNHTGFLAFRMFSAVCCGVWLELSNQKPIRGVVCILQNTDLLISIFLFVETSPVSPTCAFRSLLDHNRTLRRQALAHPELISFRDPEHSTAADTLHIVYR